jgi:hypothetical protein
VNAANGLVPVPLWIAGLHMTMLGQRVGNSGFARRLGVRETVLDPHHDAR